MKNEGKVKKMREVGRFEINGVKYVTVMWGRNAHTMKMSEYEFFMWVEKEHRRSLSAA